MKTILNWEIYSENDVLGNIIVMFQTIVIKNQNLHTIYNLEL